MDIFLRRRFAIYTFLLFFIFPVRAQSFLLETELFDRKGGWTVDAQFIGQMGSPYLLAHGMGIPVEDAVTEVKVPQKGKYHIWARTKDWAPYPKGPGRFRIIIDGETLGPDLGASGIRGWQWEYCGSVEMEKEVVEVRLHDLTGFAGRCDAVYFSKKREKPPGNADELAQFRKNRLNTTEINEGHFDLVVAGGGSAGICAAVQAARMGLKVALINNRPVLGGASSSEVRISTDGDVFRNKYPKLGRIVREIDNYHAGIGGIDEVLYNDDLRENIVRNEKNITLFKNMHVVGVEVARDRIESVKALDINTLTEHVFSGSLFADCTGDATVGLLAGAEHYYGRESKAETNETDAPGTADNLVMGSSNQWYAELTGSESEFPVEEWMHRFSDDYHFDLLRSQWNWETGFKSFHTVDDAEEVRDNNFRAIYGNWAYLKSNKKEKYGKYRLAYLSYVTGKRESYRLAGDLLLTQNDIVNKTDYPDAVVTATWGIDLHYPDRENARRFPGCEFIGYADHPMKQADVYTFPYRCLYSRNIGNLFMAGRNISVTHIALGTVRVQRCTGMMGETVGYASYLCRKHNCLPRDIYTEYLNEFISLLKE